MIIDKINHSNYIKEQNFFYITNFIEQQVFDKLYENQNNLQHFVWKQITERIHYPFKLYKDIQHFDQDHEVICLLFFKDRNQKVLRKDLSLNDTNIVYNQNCMLIYDNTNKRQFRIKVKKGFNRPVLQFEISHSEYLKFLKRVV